MSDYRAWARTNNKQILAAHRQQPDGAACGECGERYPCGPARMATRAVIAGDARVRRQQILASTGTSQNPLQKGRLVDLTNVTWMKSTRCDNSSGNCVEVAFLDGIVAVRNSTEPLGPTLLHTRPEWEAFLGGVKAGEFD